MFRWAHKLCQLSHHYLHHFCLLHFILPPLFRLELVLLNVVDALFLLVVTCVVSGVFTYVITGLVFEVLIAVVLLSESVIFWELSPNVVFIVHAPPIPTAITNIINKTDLCFIQSPLNLIVFIKQL